jgi:peptidoglycan/LPS O-acetylase OafA/YrhL
VRWAKTHEYRRSGCCLIAKQFALPAAVLIVFAATFGIATISYFLVEKNALILKKYFSHLVPKAPALHSQIAAGGIAA